MKFILKRTNQNGFSHDLLPILFVMLFAVIGSYYFVASHAASSNNWTVVANSGSGSTASTIQACQRVVSSEFGNVYQVTIQYAKPASDTGFYGYTVIDGRTNTNRSTRTDSTYTGGVSAQLTANASQVANDHISVFETSNGNVISNTNIIPATLGTCSSTTSSTSSDVNVASPSTSTKPSAAEAAIAKQDIEKYKIGPVQKVHTPQNAQAKVSGAASSAPVGEYTSPNWSGYVAQSNNGNPFNTVIGYQIVPTATCNAADSNGEVVEWAGLDGWTDSTVEQDGIGSDCVPGSSSTGYVPEYQAWWEMYPTNLIQVFNNPNGSGYFNVNPGDVVEMEVQIYYGYLLTVKDLTTGQSANTFQECNKNLTCSRNSAEWIVERPGGGSAPGGYYPLLQYGTSIWGFDMANDGSGNQVISSFPNIPVQMVVGTESPIATISSPLDLAGSGFNDYWQGSQ